MPALSSCPGQAPSCFISYSTKDQSFADRLHADLQNMGVRCWFAPHDIQGGKKIHEQIDEVIRVYDRLLLILSAHSMNSEWVKTEIAKARKRELQEKRRMLFPIRLVDFDTLRDWECLDADSGKDSAREIREYFIPEFQRVEDEPRSLRSRTRAASKGSETCCVRSFALQLAISTYTMGSTVRPTRFSKACISSSSAPSDAPRYVLVCAMFVCPSHR